MTKISDETPPPEQAEPRTPFVPMAEKIRPAVVVLITFDEHGGVVATEQAFFTSADGDLLAERTAMNNATTAIVKSADGHAYDIFGTYVRSTAPNLVSLKTNAHDVPFLTAPAALQVPDGTAAAVVLSAAGSVPSSLIEGRITGRKSDREGEWLAFEPAPPKSALGAPVIDATGAVIGVLAQRDGANTPAVFRFTGGNVPAVAQGAEASPPESSPVEAAPSPPAEGPPPRARPTPPVTGAVKPPVSTRGKIIYHPAPVYPVTLAWFHLDLRATANYRITFNPQGEATDVQIAHSSGHPLMDKAALEMLRTWRAEPAAQEWSIVVPVRFKP